MDSTLRSKPEYLNSLPIRYILHNAAYDPLKRLPNIRRLQKKIKILTIRKLRAGYIWLMLPNHLVKILQSNFLLSKNIKNKINKTISILNIIYRIYTTGSV
jgi:hypothetical protein